MFATPPSQSSAVPVVLLVTVLAVIGLVLASSLYHPVYQAVVTGTREGKKLLDRTLRTFQTSDPVHHTTMKGIQRLLKPDNVDDYSLLQSRSIPNQRLVTAFELTNTFVSADAAVHENFRRKAQRMLRRDWVEFLQVATDAANMSLPSISPGNVRQLDHFIQITTLRIVLIFLLGVQRQPKDMNDEDLQITAELISELWSRSKTQPTVDSESLNRLNHHLRRLIDDNEAFPNPLDFVIPTWETMWRVVATTVTYADDSPQYRETFGRLQTGSPATSFHDASDGPSAHSIVTEVLRLHPPSRRIHRATTRPFLGIPTFLDKFVSVTRQEMADVEAYHLSQDVWGPSAKAFDPTRHENPVAEGGDILAFGWGPLQCVAKKWAPMAIGMTVSAILEVLGTDAESGISDFILVRGERIGGREGWDGWEVRKRDHMF
ncbi:hypothetical protein AAF712_002244 [Marasmius tenuissimus]|uniref:Cytochrome P450 n=1 Tax=Marasmius tenuissimus TaxID=585030 RepID=A0ABR3ABN1_9AGAR